jgi:hypothetical protein
LTELCEAVTEGYSPLSEHMPGGSPHIRQDTNDNTPSVPSRSTLRHFVLPGRGAIHQPGVRSADVQEGRAEDI